MPHFVIECSREITEKKAAADIMQVVSDEAESSGLFTYTAPGGVKVRLIHYDHYISPEAGEGFIHVFAHIMEGKSTEQKRDLSRAIVSRLAGMFEGVPIISMSIYEFDKTSYYNRDMI